MGFAYFAFKRIQLFLTIHGAFYRIFRILKLSGRFMPYIGRKWDIRNLGFEDWMSRCFVTES